MTGGRIRISTAALAGATAAPGDSALKKQRGFPIKHVLQPLWSAGWYVSLEIRVDFLKALLLPPPHFFLQRGSLWQRRSRAARLLQPPSFPDSALASCDTRWFLDVSHASRTCVCVSVRVSVVLACGSWMQVNDRLRAEDAVRATILL